MTTQNLEPWKRLGQLLVSHGDISGEQLIRAIQSQRSVGGRIGTCLLEMQVLTEDRLLAALSEQLAVPAVRIEQLRGIDEDVLLLVPSRVALRCQAVPFAASQTEVSIATLKARDLALLDELAFCTNRRVAAHIANEVRIFEALEKYYGLECPRRYGHLLDRLNRSRYLWDESARILMGGGEEPRVVPPPRDETDWDQIFDEGQLIRPAASYSSLSLEPRPRSDEPRPRSDEPRPRSDEPRSAVRRAGVPEPAPAAPPVPVRAPTVGAPTAGTPAFGPLSLADVDRLFSHGKDREDVGEIVMRFLDQRFGRSALYQIRRGEVRGWLAQGDGLDRPHFRSFRLALDQPSVFFNLASGAEFYHGPLPPMPAHMEMMRPWGGGMPRECLAVPVQIRQRLVCVIYGDRGASDLGDLKMDVYLALARKTGAALERCILRRKSHVA